jgi:CHAT domain-containing protein
MTRRIASALAWIEDFVVIDAEAPAAEALAWIAEAAVRWLILRRGFHLYALTREEFWRWPTLTGILRDPGGPWLSSPLAAVLDLHETDRSTDITGRSAPPPIDRSWRPDATAPSVARYVEVASDGRPLAIGTAAPARERGRRASRPQSAPSPGLGLPDEPAAGSAPSRRTRVEAEVTVLARTVPARMDGGPVERTDADRPASEDEGTTPLRYPSLETDAALTPGVNVTVTVDLLRAAAGHTQGGPVAVGPQAPDWQQRDLSVVLSCPQIDFEGDGRGTVTIRRNQASVPAPVKGRVRGDTKPGDAAPVIASFFDGTRFCGSAFRVFAVAGAAASSPAVVTTPAGGTVVTEPAARQPDVTVRITRASGAPGRLDWLVETVRFDGLPPRLRETIDLPQDPAAEVAALFAEFATLERGQHRARIEGFGDRLWQRAPRMFRDVYWALWDHYGRTLTIQFISDEPHLPWELMRPVRPDESEVHPPLALKHAVARWIERWDGYMRNQLPPGGVFTIAPRYATASRLLPRAQTESQTLVDRFRAQRVDGTRQAVKTLLETAPPVAPVALLHFAGHGHFVRTATTASSISLEDGALAASEIERPEVKLGKACRTLVFFNACEVGSTGSILGEIGGWADAFLGRQFGGFIAPLWSVDDEDAGVVAAELLQGILERHQPIGEVLRALRVKHGDVSPTFYSYLYYGDVTACLTA